jgi:hypothetical protein
MNYCTHSVLYLFSETFAESPAACRKQGRPRQIDTNSKNSYSYTQLREPGICSAPNVRPTSLRIPISAASVDYIMTDWNGLFLGTLKRVIVKLLTFLVHLPISWQRAG